MIVKFVELCLIIAKIFVFPRFDVALYSKVSKLDIKCVEKSS